MTSATTLRLLAILLLVTPATTAAATAEGGQVTGEVHLLSDPPPRRRPGRPGLVSVDDLDRHNPITEGGARAEPTVWTFDFEPVPSGRVLPGRCFTFGCGSYTDIEGNPAPVDVRPNETVTATLAF